MSHRRCSENSSLCGFFSITGGNAKERRQARPDPRNAVSKTSRGRGGLILSNGARIGVVWISQWLQPASLYKKIKKIFSIPRGPREKRVRSHSLPDSALTALPSSRATLTPEPCVCQCPALLPPFSPPMVTSSLLRAASRFLLSSPLLSAQTSCTSCIPRSLSTSVRHTA